VFEGSPCLCASVAYLEISYGFVVTTAAYDRFVADNSLAVIINSTLQDEKSIGARASRTLS